MPSRSNRSKKKGLKTTNNSSSHASKKNFKKKHHKKTFQNNKKFTNVSLDNEMFDFDGPIPPALLPASLIDSLNTKRKINSRSTKNASTKLINYRKMPVFEKLRLFPVAFVKASEVYDPSALLNSRIKNQEPKCNLTESNTKTEAHGIKIPVEFSESQSPLSETIDSYIPVHTVSKENHNSNDIIPTTEIIDGSVAKKQVNLESKLENLKILDLASVDHRISDSNSISHLNNRNTPKSRKVKASLNTEDLDFDEIDFEYDYEEDHAYTYPYDPRATVADEDELQDLLADLSDFEEEDDDVEYEEENDKYEDYEEEEYQKEHEEEDNEDENDKDEAHENIYQGKHVSTTVNVETITDSLGNIIYQGEFSNVDNDDDDQYSWGNASDYSGEENNQEGYFQDEINELNVLAITEEHSLNDDDALCESSESKDDQYGDMNEDVSAKDLLNIGRLTGVKFGGINSHIVDDYMDDIDPYITQSVRYKGKGKKKRPILEDRIDDINLINDLTEQFNNRRLSKNDKKQLKRQNKRNGAILSNLTDLTHKYPFAMDVNDINSEIIDFLEDLKRVALTFPSLGNLGNLEVMRHCSFYNTKSRVMGTNNKKYVVAIKTKKTHRLGQVFTRLPKVTTASQTTVRVFERIDVKLGRAKKTATGGYGHAEGAKVGKDAPAIDENNIGKQLLMKLGWSNGEGLGAAHNKGISEPLVATFKRSKQGLRIIDS